MKISHKILAFLISMLFVVVTWEDLYSNTSPVNKINNMNFAKRVTNNRKKGIIIVHFYKESDIFSAQYKQEYEDFAKNNKGMYDLGSINCDTNSDICKKEGAKDFPLFRIYPPHPLPVVDLDKDNYSFKKLLKQASKFVESKVIEITSVNHDTFIKDNPSKAKVLLFTEQKDVPSIYKALSYNFDKTLFFGIVRSAESNLQKKYKVKDFPTIILINPGDKPRKYEGAINYYGISNFINIYSELFDFGDQTNEPTENAAAKPWMSAPLPELTKASSNDIWFNRKGLWVILFLKESPTEGMIETINTVRSEFTSNLEDRGQNFSFMWVDANLHDDWVKKLDVTQIPSIVILNIGKTKKYLKHETELITESSLSGVLNSIIAGNARFTRVEDNVLPVLKNK